MGKRSDFERIPRDFYPTPEAAVAPLISHLKFGDSFMEPCAGNGALVRHLENHGMSCKAAWDIDPRASWIQKRDALDDHGWPYTEEADYIITNPPWSRNVLHPMIVEFSTYLPTWLLFDADWAHTRQASPFLPRLRKIVSVGRVKWIPDSPFTGKDNACWYLFDKPSDEAPTFHGRISQCGGGGGLQTDLMDFCA